ncbi:MAG: NAD(P)-binding protein [Lachnospiraceae bacterium]|nr:NAD(P)-binding protein [Lachnospiraceae bacterium]
MKYLIIGAGPAGLSFACRLLAHGEKDFLVLEKEDEAGGLCRSALTGGAPLDIGGGHFLDVKKQPVLDFLFGFMKEEEWDLYERDSRIFINDTMIGSPIEANIWQMKLSDQVAYLKAIAIAGCNLEVPMPKRFVDWIYWKLGKRIAEDYMIPYNRKMFGENLDELGTYWLEKLPNVSFEETLLSCLEKKAYGKQPAHARFYYPKHFGYGEVWRRMAQALENRLQLNVTAETLDLDRKTVNGTYEAETIITTVPWTGFSEIIGLPETFKRSIGFLKYSSIVVDYKAENLDTKAHWIYYPDPALSYHRILVRHNFCPGASGYWTETNLTRFDESTAEKGQYFINPYAYPLNTIGKNEAMEELLSFTRQKGVYGLGRWGEWQHYNSDVVVERSMALADKLIKKQKA